MTAPSISVVIPVFNTENYLAEAIESVLGQTLPPSQVAVVDDGSTDESVAVARCFGLPVTVLQQPNAGVGAARNTGIAATTAEFLAFLDADDYWPAEKLALQAAALAADRRLDLVLGHVQPFLADDAPPGVRAAANLTAIPGYLAGAMLIRRESFLRVGLFATDVRLGEFIDWFSRAERAGLRSAMLSEVVLHRRLHANNTGLRERDQRADYLAVVRRAMAARASGGGSTA